MTTWQPPFWRSICVSTRPVGPAPNMSTLEPILGAILSSPWAAHEAGSSRVASTSLRFLMWKTRLAGYAQYSANPPSMVTPWAWKSSQRSSSPRRQ